MTLLPKSLACEMHEEQNRSRESVGFLFLLLITFLPSVFRPGLWDRESRKKYTIEVCLLQGQPESNMVQITTHAGVALLDYRLCQTWF